MSWVAIALAAYLFLAVANLIDKFLVDNVLPNSKTYAFIVCLFGGFLFLAAPWFLKWPGVYWFVINIISGAVFAIALWTLYESLQRGEASRSLVFIGGLTPIFSIFFSSLFFKEQFSLNEWLGIITLLIGIAIVAFLPTQRSFLARLLRKLRFKQKIKTNYLIFAIISAFSYAVYFSLTKYAYSAQPFASAFIWGRLGALLFVLLFLINKKNRKIIFKTLRKPKKNKNNFLVLVGQALGSLGFILQNLAISLGPVVLVNALQGAQYAFLLIISTVLALLSPKLLKETFSWPIFLQKSAAVLVIAIGLGLILF